MTRLRVSDGLGTTLLFRPDVDLRYAVYVNGHTADVHTDPLSAINHAARAKARDSEADVAIVVLTREEVELSDEEIRVRPFYPHPRDVAQQAVKQSRQPALLGATDGSDKEGV